MKHGLLHGSRYGGVFVKRAVFPDADAHPFRERFQVDVARFPLKGGSQQTVQFQQPSATSWTLNRVTAPDPSVIAGRITANGGVAIVNQSGVVFA